MHARLFHTNLVLSTWKWPIQRGQIKITIIFIYVSVKLIISKKNLRLNLILSIFSENNIKLYHQRYCRYTIRKYYVKQRSALIKQPSNNVSSRIIALFTVYWTDITPNRQCSHWINPIILTADCWEALNCHYCWPSFCTFYFFIW